MIDRSRLFRLAWQNARFVASRRAIPIRAAFAQALRQAWATLKREVAMQAALAAATAQAVATIAAVKAAGRPAFIPRPWRFANTSGYGM